MKKRILSFSIPHTWSRSCNHENKTNLINPFARMRFSGLHHHTHLLTTISPGFGGTNPIALSQRIPIFLEIVPALLAHLKIKNVALGCQSAGTLFALNLLLTQPEILSPTHPSITIFSPWVHQSQSGITMLLAASKLPNFLLDHWSNLTGFMINSAMPSFAASSGILTAVSNWFGSVKTVETNPETLKKDKEYFEKVCMQSYGISMDVQKELNKLVMKYAFAEECSGGNDEARLCLKSIEGSDWGVLDDYPSYIAKLREAWEKKVQEGGEKLTVRILLAEEDVMIGEKGMKYLEGCWTKKKCGKVGIDVETVTLEGTDHDSVLDPARGAMGEVYAALREGRRAFPLAEDVIGSERDATE